MVILNAGDPTIFKNFNTHQCVVDAVQEELQSFEHNGYPPAIGKFVQDTLIPFNKQ